MRKKEKIRVFYTIDKDTAEAIEKDALQKGFKRKGDYISYVVENLNKHRVPPAFKYKELVEKVASLEESVRLASVSGFFTEVEKQRLFENFSIIHEDIKRYISGNKRKTI